VPLLPPNTCFLPLRAIGFAMVNQNASPTQSRY
jgi:hypothetical protein